MDQKQNIFDPLNLPYIVKCIGSKNKCLTIPQLNIMSFAAAIAEAEPLVSTFVNELESGIEVARLGYVHDIPSIESIETASATAITPAAVGFVDHNLSTSNSNSNRYGNMPRRPVRRRPIPVAPRFVGVRSVVPASRRIRRRRYPLRRRRRRIGAAGFRAWNTSAAIGSSSSSHGRAMFVKRMMRPTQVLATTENLPVIDYDAGSSSAYGFQYSFKLSDVPGYANWTNMYRWFKIVGVKLIFVPLQNTHNGLSQSNATNPIKAIGTSATTLSGLAPRFIVAPDNSSLSAFSSEQQALSHDHSKMHCFNGGAEFVVSMRPMAQDVIGLAGATARTDKPPTGFIETSAAGIAIKHHGLRCWCEGVHNAVQVIVYQEISVALKGLKL